jgi:TusA-related sulfurtransferase
MDNTGDKYITDCPSWYDRVKIVKTIDIREMLNKGEQPVHEVISAIKSLNKGEILEVIAPFIPAPLIDKSMSLEYKHWLEKKSGTEYRVFFTGK